MLSELLMSLAKGLMSKLGGKIFSSVFGDESPEQLFQEMVAEIKKIIHVAEVSNDITMIKGTLDGVISQMTIDYVNKKNSGASKEVLNSFLADVEQTLDVEIMGPLQALTDVSLSKGNAQQSLLVFVLGAGMQFAVLQEMAKTDPKESDPTKSQYAADIIAYAKKYATRATTILAQIKKSRFDAISPVTCMGKPVDVVAQTEQKTESEASLGWPTGGQNYTFSVKDDWTGQTVCSNTSMGSLYSPCSKSLPAYGKSTSCRASYISSQETDFTHTWAPAQQNIDAWNDLVNNPVSEYASNEGVYFT